MNTLISWAFLHKIWHNRTRISQLATSVKPLCRRQGHFTITDSKVQPLRKWTCIQCSTMVSWETASKDWTHHTKMQSYLC